MHKFRDNNKEFKSIKAIKFPFTSRTTEQVTFKITDNTITFNVKCDVIEISSGTYSIPSTFIASSIVFFPTTEQLAPESILAAVAWGAVL